jgi:aspartyl protease family protein
MGHVRINIKLGHPERPDEMIEVIDALVDTGATFTIVPRVIAKEIGLAVYGRSRARSAAGPIELDESYALFEYEDRRTVTPVLINDDYPGVLIGVLTLEALALAVDPKSGKLINTELLLL